MTMRQRAWTWSALGFVVVAAMLGALVERLTNHVAARVEARFGYVPNPEGVREFLAELEHPTFGDAAPDVMRNAKNRDTFLYRHADRAHRAVYGTPFGCWNQGNIGTCVSFGWGMGSYIGQAVDWTQGERSEPPKLVATEAIYGGSRTAGRLPPISNAGFSDGSYGAAAARWIVGTKSGVGGVLFRQKYGDVDLTEYSIPRAREWGNSGVPLALAKAATEHTAQGVGLCDTYDAMCAAIENGFCVPICSNVGYAATNVRDADGFLPRGGQWGHCMVAIAVRYADGPGGRDGVLVLNSWGPNWVKGPKWPDDQPEGSFWARRADVEAMLAQGDSFVIAGANGFEARDLDNGAWLDPVPRAEPARTLPSGSISLSQ